MSSALAPVPKRSLRSSLFTNTAVPTMSNNNNTNTNGDGMKTLGAKRMPHSIAGISLTPAPLAMKHMPAMPTSSSSALSAPPPPPPPPPPLPASHALNNCKTITFAHATAAPWTLFVSPSPPASPPTPLRSSPLSLSTADFSTSSSPLSIPISLSPSPPSPGNTSPISASEELSHPALVHPAPEKQWRTCSSLEDVHDIATERTSFTALRAPLHVSATYDDPLIRASFTSNINADSTTIDNSDCNGTQTVHLNYQQHESLSRSRLSKYLSSLEHANGIARPAMLLDNQLHYRTRGDDQTLFIPSTTSSTSTGGLETCTPARTELPLAVDEVLVGLLNTLHVASAMHRHASTCGFFSSAF